MKSIPVVDLFAGPGGLGEGFCRFPQEGELKFKICLSVEKDKCAHKTLLLRSFYRQIREHSTTDNYFKYLGGDIEMKELVDAHPKLFAIAQNETMRVELGPNTRNEISDIIDGRIRNQKSWVLIGGPPCQAYSLIGRSRVLGAGTRKNSTQDMEEKTRKYESDTRHFLYKEYLRIIADHSPPIFVMENVRGILSSRINGELIFPQILDDLKDPGSALEKPRNLGRPKYKIRSFVEQSDESGHYESGQYIIRCEDYDIPQARHRVVLLGVREDLNVPKSSILKRSGKRLTTYKALSDLPQLRSGLSKETDSLERWQGALLESLQNIWMKELGDSIVKNRIKKALSDIKVNGFRFDRGAESLPIHAQPELNPQWTESISTAGVYNHSTRGHIRSDLQRYLFAACYAQAHDSSPRMKNFPPSLRPQHANIDEAVESGKFGDRFKVQLGGAPSSTVTSHISKDGHYYIHPDAHCCRSLTVREAARLQTFPDDYFFEGPRTAQYIQVGNAVPPYLAYQIAEVVDSILRENQNG